MATREQHSIQGQVVTELEQVQARQKRLPLDQNHQFRYWVAPERVYFSEGVCLYNPVAIGVIPGIQNVPESGDPTTIDGYQLNRAGRTKVPMDFECIAWGELVRGYLVKLFIGADTNGKQLYHFHDVWTRYEKLGASYVRSFDYEGWRDFCKRVESIKDESGQVLGPPHPQIQSAERSRQLTLLDQHRRVSRGGESAEVDRIRANLAPPAKPEKAATK